MCEKSGVPSREAVRPPQAQRGLRGPYGFRRESAPTFLSSVSRRRDASSRDRWSLHDEGFEHHLAEKRNLSAMTGLVVEAVHDRVADRSCRIALLGGVELFRAQAAEQVAETLVLADECFPHFGQGWPASRAKREPGCSPN